MSSATNPPSGRRRRTSERGQADPGGAAPGRVRWRRFAIIFLPAVGLSAALLGLVAHGALAASFSISGQLGETSADSLTGVGFQQFGTADVPAKGGIIAVAESEIGTAHITNLCQSLVESVPIIGDVTLTIKGGGGGTPATAHSLVIDANQLGGDSATFSNIQEGIDASKVTDAGMPGGIAGNFAQQATQIKITNMKEVAYSTAAGTFTLPGFSLSLTTGNTPCFPGGPVNTFSLG